MAVRWKFVVHAALALKKGHPPFHFEFDATSAFNILLGLRKGVYCILKSQTDPEYRLFLPSMRLTAAFDNKNFGVGIHMGALEYFSDLFGGRKKFKKRRQLKTVELKVRMDCDGCERKVRKALSSLSGVQSVEIDRKLQKVTVSGYVEANKVLEKVKETGKLAEMWPYVPYNLVSEPYSPHTYDKKAPPGYVRKESFNNTTSNSNSLDEQFTTIFSEENPTGCTIM